MTNKDWIILRDVIASVERACCAAEAHQHKAMHEHFERAYYHIDQAMMDAPKAKLS